MKKLLIAAWLLFFTGIVFKLFHLPAGHLLSMAGALLLWIHGFIFLSKRAETDLPGVLLHLTFAAWATYSLFRMQYWNYAQWVFAVAVLLTLGWFIQHMVKRPRFGFLQGILVVYFALSVWLSFTHADRVYYFFALNETLHSEERTYAYAYWDKYSWFLHLAGKKAEALEANANALKAIDASVKAGNAQAFMDGLVIIQHQKQLQSDSWMSYP